MLEIRIAEHLTDNDIKQIFNIDYDIDRITALKEMLKKYALDPRFEQYGNFVNRSPKWLNPEIQEKYNGCTQIWGNFNTCSFNFSIITDNEDIIKEIETLVNENRDSEAYKQAVVNKLIHDTKDKIVNILRYYKKGVDREKLNNYLLQNSIIDDVEIFEYQITKIVYTTLTDSQVLEVNKLIA